MIITTNYIIQLDNVLIQSDYVNMQIKLKLTDKKMTVNLFCIIFKFIKGDFTPSEYTRLEDNKKIYKAVRI